MHRRFIYRFAKPLSALQCRCSQLHGARFAGQFCGNVSYCSGAAVSILHGWGTYASGYTFSMLANTPTSCITRRSS
jgi:hypothetical protein